MQILKRNRLGLLGLVMVLFGLVIFASPHKALADPITTYIPRSENQIKNATLTFGADRSTINVNFVADGSHQAGSVSFVDSDPTDTTYNYQPASAFCGTGGSGGIWFNKDKAGDLTPAQLSKSATSIKAYVDLDYLDPAATSDTSSFKDHCNNTTKGSAKDGNYLLSVGKLDAARPELKWGGDNKTELDPIAPLGDHVTLNSGQTAGRGGPISDVYSSFKDWTFKPTTYDNLLRFDVNSNCPAVAVVNSDSTQADVYILGNSSEGSVDAGTIAALQNIIPDKGSCYVAYMDYITKPSQSQVNNPVSFKIVGKRGTVPSQGGDGSTSGPTNDNVNNGDGCVFDSGLDWFICPIISGLGKAADESNGFIEGQLNFDVNANLNGQIHTAWAVFKNLVSVVLVIMLLVMVIAQATGSGPFEAYTVRKILPKLVIAVIFMQLSWGICIYLISLANDAGQGVAQLMAAPFGGVDSLTLKSLIHHASNVWSAGLAAGTTITTLLLGPLLLYFYWPLLLMLGFSVFMSVILALLTLMLRNAIIVLAVITSPLAIVAWVLPGTKKQWDFWKSNFSKALMLFPLTMGIIYGGRIFAWTVGNLGKPGPFDLLMIFVGFFGPYFFIPKAFKWGGSILAAGSNAIQTNGLTKKAREGGMNELKGMDERWKGKMARDLYNPNDPDALRYRAVRLGYKKGENGKMQKRFGFLPKMEMTDADVLRANGVDFEKKEDGSLAPRRDEHGNYLDKHENVVFTAEKDEHGNTTGYHYGDDEKRKLDSKYLSDEKDEHGRSHKVINPASGYSKLGVPMYAGRLAGRMGARQFMPTVRGKARTILQGAKYAGDRNEEATAIAHRIFEKAQEDGYDSQVVPDDQAKTIQDYLNDEDPNWQNLKGSDGKIQYSDEPIKALDGRDLINQETGEIMYKPLRVPRLNPETGRPNLVRTHFKPGIAASKQAVVDLTSLSKDEDPEGRIQKLAIKELLDTSSWPEIANALIGSGANAGKHVWEVPSWEAFVGTNSEAYPKVQNSRYDLAPHILQMTYKDKDAAIAAKMGRKVGDRLATVDRYEKTISGEMAPENFYTQSQGFYDDAIEGVLEAIQKGNTVSVERLGGAFTKRLDELAGMGEDGQRILGKLSTGALGQRVDELLRLTTGGKSRITHFKPGTEEFRNRHGGTTRSELPEPMGTTPATGGATPGASFAAAGGVPGTSGPAYSSPTVTPTPTATSGGTRPLYYGTAPPTAPAGVVPPTTAAPLGPVELKIDHEALKEGIYEATRRGASAGVRQALRGTDFNRPSGSDSGDKPLPGEDDGSRDIFPGETGPR